MAVFYISMIRNGSWASIQLILDRDTEGLSNDSQNWALNPQE